MRLAGRGAGRPGADRHGGRGPRHPRARRRARRSQRCATSSIGLARRRARDGRRRPAARDWSSTSGKPEHAARDFLVRGLLGADPDAGSIAVGDAVERRARSCACTRATPARPTATCARRSSCAARRWAAARPAGALVFTCNGRGREMFGVARPRRAAPWPTSSAAPRPPASSRPARSGRSAAQPFLHGFTATVGSVRCP